MPRRGMPQLAMSKQFVFTLPNYTDVEYNAILNSDALAYVMLGR
jgi:hypothetical protein